YEAIPGPPGHSSRFELMKTQPEAGAWALASRDDRMLVGNSTGVFSLEADGRFTPVLALPEMVHLVMVGEELCYAIGRREISVLQWKDGSWSEGAARVPGLGQSAFAHAAARSVWIECGGNRVARLELTEGQLE